MRRLFLTLAMLSLGALAAQTPPAVTDEAPQTLEAFRTAAAAVLAETGVPGAGVALVRPDGLEWAGGIGYADRESKAPVTADTHFRVGSISKTFVALGLVQLSEDGQLDLESPVREVLPDVAIENDWDSVEPVRVIHLLEHTAGFDDMHFNETYLPAGEPDRSLDDVLAINPRSRRVRWRPGTRMSYSNPGYALAGLVLERIAGEPYEEYIEREIFEPLDMPTSSFRLTPDDETRLARGYAGPDGPPVAVRRIYLRPAGNLHSSARELGHFVQMLLGWGERGSAFVIDPEYLGNMEQPRTGLAVEAGLRTGYGAGIAMRLDLPYKVLGHNGGIEGFVSSYGYSPSRDAGYVVLLNSGGPRAGEALTRLSSLALRYLKRGVAPPEKPTASLEAQTLDPYTGYYHDASPRNQFGWALQYLLAGRTIVRDGDRLVAEPVWGEPVPLIPVNDTMFRFERDLDARIVFTTDPEGRPVMAGGLYAERRPRWQVEAVRIPVIAAVLTIASVFVVAIVWVARWRAARPQGFWALKVAALSCPLAVLTPAAALTFTPIADWGMKTPGTTMAFLGTLAIPALAVAVSLFTLLAVREGASRAFTTYTAVVACAMGGLSLYLSHHGLLGLRLWAY